MEESGTRNEVAGVVKAVGAAGNRSSLAVETFHGTVAEAGRDVTEDALEYNLVLIFGAREVGEILYGGELSGFGIGGVISSPNYVAAYLSKLADVTGGQLGAFIGTFGYFKGTVALGQVIACQLSMAFPDMPDKCL